MTLKQCTKAELIEIIESLVNRIPSGCSEWNGMGQEGKQYGDQ